MSIGMKHDMIFYDGATFKGVEEYATLWGIGATDMNFKLRVKQPYPTSQSYTNIIFLVKEKNKAKFKDIIESHKKFKHEFQDTMFDVEGMTHERYRVLREKNNWLAPFDDVSKQEAPKPEIKPEIKPEVKPEVPTTKPGLLPSVASDLAKGGSLLPPKPGTN